MLRLALQHACQAGAADALLARDGDGDPLLAQGVDYGNALWHDIGLAGACYLHLEHWRAMIPQSLPFRHSKFRQQPLLRVGKGFNIAPKRHRRLVRIRLRLAGGPDRLAARLAEQNRRDASF